MKSSTVETSAPLRIVAHRCLGFGERENSAAALRAALKSSVDEVELDFRLSSDGAFVASHLEFYPDLRGFPRRVSKNTLRDNQNYGRMSLEEALSIFAECGASKRLRIELKTSGEEATAIAALRRRALVERVTIVSWRASALRKLRQLAGELDLSYSFLMGFQGSGWIPVAWPTRIPEALRDPDIQVKSVNVLSPFGYPGEEYISLLRDAGFDVFVRARSGPEERLRLIRLGVSGALTSSKDLIAPPTITSYSAGA